MEKFNKYWSLIVAVVGVLVGVAGWLYNQGAMSKSTEGRIFDTPEQKVEVVKYVEESPSPEEIWRKHIMDSINTINAIKSRAKRDSLLIKEHKARLVADSINRLNADQMYQIKEELKILKDRIIINN